MDEYTLSINGQTRVVRAEPNWTLLRVLRDELQLTGTKFGCGTGDCGACRVLVDWEAMDSCVLPVSRAAGKEIITIEGVSDGTHLHPVQQAFIDAGAIQCGYCTPGMVINALALLHHNPDPSEDEIKDAFSHNLCRCTGYRKIIRAVGLAARKMREGSV